MPNSSIKLLVLKSTNEIALESINQHHPLNGSKIVCLELEKQSKNKHESINLALKSVNINTTNITRLTLSYCQLYDLPDFINVLQLKVLNVSHNQLRSIPQCIINDLSFLEKLDLSYNLIEDFEQEPKCVVKLRVLNLSYNNIKYIPLWILLVKSTNLIELCYNRNTIGVTKEYNFHNVAMYQLEKLELQNCDIMLDNYPFLKSICTLVNLNMSNISYMLHKPNHFHECLFDNPSWKDKIEILNLNNLMTSFLSENICLLRNIKELYLSQNKLFCLPDCIGNLKYLEVLDVSHNSIFQFPSTLNNLQNLRVLNAQSNCVPFINGLGDLNNLKILDLYDNDIEYFDYNIENLDALDLEKNQFDTSILGQTYTSKRDDFRAEFEFTCREIGNRKNESVILDSSSDLSYEKHETEELYEIDCGEIETSSYFGNSVAYVEEECWDAPKFKSHPDVTPSDEEWEGHVPKSKKIMRRNSSQLNLKLYTLFADAD